MANPEGCIVTCGFGGDLIADCLSEEGHRSFFAGTSLESEWAALEDLNVSCVVEVPNRWVDGESQTEHFSDIARRANWRKPTTVAKFTDYIEDFDPETLEFLQNRYDIWLLDSRMLNNPHEVVVTIVTVIRNTTTRRDYSSRLALVV